MIIRITENYIKNGKPRQACNCPVSNAIRDQLNGVISVSVSANRILISLEDKTIDIEPPIQVIAFILGFDAYKNMKPFEFELPI